jgi:glutamate synthase (NADPH) small chain
VRALRTHEVEMVDGRFQKVEGSDFELEADLVFLAMGFTGPRGLLEQLGVELDPAATSPATTGA